MNYLDNHRILKSNNLDELRELMSSLNSLDELDIKHGSPDINADISVVDIAGLSLIDSGFGDTIVRHKAFDSNPDSLTFVMPTCGSGTGTTKGVDFEVTQDLGFMRDMGVSAIGQQQNFRCIGMYLSKSDLKRRAKAIIGDDLNLKDIEFDISIDFSTPEGKYLRSYIHHVTATLNGPLKDTFSPIMLHTMRDTLIMNILTCIPNSYTEFLNTQNQLKIFPYHIKRARDYIHENVDKSITLEDLAGYAGCSYRTLQLSFRDSFGMSPMGYLKSVRLDKIHQQLLAAGPNETIQSISSQWGFMHMGRFAHDYKKKFGILPSHTLRGHQEL